ncbi:MAG TPA: NAD+ synthase [Burkholderiales bacterium]|jgi:NAD+ synthetase|nr:NAD+ synthase [Burkholderiales bacterium]
MRIAIGQINCTVGDLSGNSRKILEYAQRARDGGADLLLTPELSLCGYPPEDLLLREDFRAACGRALGELAAQVRGIDVLVGHPDSHGGRLYNAASLLREGRVHATYRKHDLPNYTVFDEERYFEPGSGACVVEVAGVRVGINICEDVWGAEGESIARLSTDAQGRAVGVSVAADAWRPVAPQMARDAGAQVLLVLNASPFHIDKLASRHEVVRSRTAQTGMPVVFCNLVGGQDELVFDGASFVMDAGGRLTHQLPAFEEQLAFAEFAGAAPLPGQVVPEPETDASIYRALCLGVRDYLGKNRFPGALLGLSGGIDSALTLCIAADALGPDKVHAVMMPSQFTADMSVDDSREMARLLGVRYSEIAIKPMFDVYLQALAPQFGDRPFDATEENLQSRIRGALLMALSNKFGAIVLTTGNKSEMSTGYATLYGDMAGGFAVLKDLTKKYVYRLARHRNGISPAIPERVITRPPSAELRPGQVDQDSLPEYDHLDAIVELYVEQDRSIAEIVAAGHRREDVEKVVRLIHLNEYKRRQAPVGIRITRRGFGKDWRYPVTNKYRGGL